jgi:predicted phosphate transport protein (TIGR00153 family)
MSSELLEMSDVLKQLTYETNTDEQAKYVQILRDKEKINDVHVANLFNELGKNFITPFDREDVHSLATALDDISDNIYTAAKKIHLHRVNPNEPEIQKMASLICDSCKQVHKAVTELKNMKNMRLMTDAIAIIREIENQCDDVFDGIIQHLYLSPEIDAKELIKRKEIYSKLETVSDKCEDAANVMESIIVKYA